MDFDFGAGGDELRSRLRTLIADELPADFLGAFTDDPADLEVTRQFCRLLASEGLLTLAWPRRYGGAESSVWEQTVVREEMWAHHEPRGAQYMGLNWVGPAIMRFGTDQQRDKYLKRIADADIIWCQGFSEPGAGSDLAALQTRAVQEDGGWRINGQKIWTSYALMADACVLAVRTSAGADRHRGISIMLIPMDRAGITVRPIQAMVGPHHLNECFFDDVEATDDDVLGEVNNGWEIIRFILAHERIGIARYARDEKLMSQLRAVIGSEWQSQPPSLRQDWIKALVSTRTARLLAYRAVAAQESGDEARANLEASRARIAVTRCDQEVGDLLFSAIGERSIEDAESDAILHGGIEDHWRYAQAATIASGTIEIQRMLVARELLRD